MVSLIFACHVVSSRGKKECTTDVRGMSKDVALFVSFYSHKVYEICF